jgi:carbon-monoxide dehydrogenase medium subunit
MFTVDMDHAELITEVRLPKIEPVEGATAVGSTYHKHAERSGDYAIVGVAAIVHVDDDERVVEADVAVGSVGPLFRAEAAEAVVEGTTLDDETLESAAERVSQAAMADEMGREGNYREQMAGVFTKRALQTAYDRATGRAD